MNATCSSSLKLTFGKTSTPRSSSSSRIFAACSPPSRVFLSARISVAIRGVRSLVVNVIAKVSE